jgi:uncharacterized protein involved in type VI secretion and phage assembly
MADVETLQQVLELIRSRFYGKYRGVVVDNRDGLKNKGRLKVKVPAVLGDEEVWALPSVPYAGKGTGLFLTPETGTGVWVEFEAGDISHPIWSGCYWADGDLDPDQNQPDQKSLVTNKVSIRIDDSVGEIEIKTAGGSSIKIAALEIIQESNAVTNKAGGKKTALTAVSFNVHDGAFEVV